MNELDLKEVLWMLRERIKELESYINVPQSGFMARSDRYIDDILAAIKEGE